MKIRTKLVTTAMLFWLVGLLAINVQAQTVTVRTYGCLAGNSETKQISKVHLRTGWQALDNTLLEDIGALNRLYGVNVPLYFLDDGSKNAFFTDAKFPNLIQAEGGNPMFVTGSVFFDASLLKKEYEDGKGNAMSIPAILGHEYAHAMQYSRNFPYGSKWRELHADYMAGWFIALRGIYRPQDPNRAWRSISEKGDYDFFEAGHHGTPQERAEAFAMGYNLLVNGRQTSGVNAYLIGLQFVRAKGAS